MDEIAEGDPVEVARTNARLKADAVATSAEGPSLRGPEDETRAILAVDTIVVLDGAIHGKPRDASHARAMLETLSGREHEVVSGLALRRDGRVQTVHATTRVQFRDVQPLLQWYLRTGEWNERAGAYAIQGRGAAFVTRIDGDYLNVVGLPVAALLDLWPEVLRLTR